jgi:hypothetical protein
MNTAPTPASGAGMGEQPVTLVDSLRGVAREFSSGRAIKQLAREARWAGNAVRCACCGWRGRAFRPSCHDRPGVPLLCARCMSGPDDRAILLKLREISPSLPMGARILDVEPSPYTRRWFDRFNQFDYRTLGRSAPDVEIQGDLTSVTLTKGICHLIVCSRGFDQSQDLMAVALALHRLTGAGGTVLVSAATGVPGTVSTVNLKPALEAAEFTVTIDNMAQRVTPDQARRYGLIADRAILACTTSLPTPDRQRAHIHSH